MTIPSVVHYCWFGGAPKPPEVRRCMESWRRVLPDCEVVEWNESNIPTGDPYLEAALARGLWSKASNLVRLQVLRDHGGIYLDTDVEVVRPFGRLLEEACVVGFQQRENTSDWVNNAVLLAAPGHPFLSACIDLTRDHFQRTGEFLRSPQVTTTVLKDAGLHRYGDQYVESVRVVPKDFFYPHAWNEAFDPGQLTENTYCIHHWRYSWRDRGAAINGAGRAAAAARLKALVPERVRHARPYLEARRRGALALAGLRRAWRPGKSGSDPVVLALVRSRGRVMGGPYRGMKYLAEPHLPHFAAKLLGTFEQELHPWIQEWLRADYEAVFDLGCRDGYHAVGLARARPDLAVVAYDEAPENRTLTRRLAALNGVGARVRVEREPPWPLLERRDGARTLVLSRPGSGLEAWLESVSPAALNGVDLLLEAVDMDGPGPNEAVLRDRFGETHAVACFRHGGRRSLDCPVDHPELSAATRLALVDECRDHPTCWFFIAARVRSP